MTIPNIKPDVIKFEVRRLSGESIQKSQQKKRGGFARFLSGIGRLFGAIAAPLSFIFPPAALGAAAAYGVSNVGDIMQRRAMRKTVEDQTTQAGGGMGQVFIPGLTQASMDLTRDTGVYDPIQSNRLDQVSSVLAARNSMDMASAQQV